MGDLVDPTRGGTAPDADPPAHSAGAPASEEATSLHALFEAQAARVPHRDALGCRHVSMTYAELDAAANRLAHHLRAAGAGPGACVALCVERSADMITGLLGILKAGAAYVPLLPDAPRARLAHQLGETEPPVIVTHRSLAAALPQTAARVVFLDADRAVIEGESPASPGVRTSPRDLAYVIYTSGSTGVPKGVAVRHDNLLNYTRFLTQLVRARDFDASGGLSWITVSTLAADLGNTSIFSALASGGTLHVAGQELALDGDALGAYCALHRIDVLKITPSHLHALLASEGGASVLPRRVLITGGEASTWGLVDRVRALAPALRWINHYGPTETTIGSLTFDLDEAPKVRSLAATVPIGRPIAHTRVHVRGDGGAPVREGEPGELYIGGRGVSSGYLRQPERTAERFVPDPFSEADGGLLYRTGDRVRSLPGGALEFLGRVDLQVKIRGHRVELGEVEAALREHPSVREVVVTAREVHPHDVRLVAYIVPTGDAPPADELRRAARDRLPDPMIPSVLVPLSSLPLTPNGKVDRSALPDPFDAPERPRHETIPPPSRTHVDPGFEEEVAAIWRAVLGVSAVRADDDFFQLGGHSLAAIHMLAEVHRRTGKRISSAVLFSAPTVRGVADALRRAPSRPTFRSLIPIQAKGRRPPLFCVHGGGGHVFWYKALARRLGDDQPFYGLQHRIEDDGHVHTRTVEDMATHYLDEIREAFPRGPYYLAGASFGGKVAYEMARRLRESGETVALLAMFDSWGPDYPRLRDDVSDLGRRARAAYLRVQHHAGALWLLDDTSQRMAYVRQKLHWGYMESLDSVGRAAVAVARWTYVKRGREGSIPRDLRESPGFIKEASLAYEPLPYDGDVVLFRSLVQPPGAVRDDWLGWRDLVRGELIVIEVPGMHAAMVVEPRVRFLVAELRPILEAAQARYG